MTQRLGWVDSLQGFGVKANSLQGHRSAVLAVRLFQHVVELDEDAAHVLKSRARAAPNVFKRGQILDARAGSVRSIVQCVQLIHNTAKPLNY